LSISKRRSAKRRSSAFPAAASPERSIKRWAIGRLQFGHMTIFGRLTKTKSWAYAAENDGSMIAGRKKR
jgi:uncharacterized membrane protein